MNSCICWEFEYGAEFALLESRRGKTNWKNLNDFSLLENAFHFELSVTKY